MTPLDPRVKECLKNREWRLNNLYSIKDKAGQCVKFRMNWAQKEIFDNLHNRNIILKCRQLGCTTFFAIYFLDHCLWNSNINAAIIADIQVNSREIFIDKVKYAYDNLNPIIKEMVQAHRDSATELRFSNGSVFRVSTSLRSGTVQMLHISEFGKICRDEPKKADEIISGALNTVEAGQFITIESTAEGSAGHFYDLCKRAEAHQKSGQTLTEMDYKYFFFPWHREPSYKLGAYVEPKKEMKEYFEKLESKGILLGGEQMAWYMKKYEEQGDAIYKEFPSLPEECFQASASGLYYGRHITLARLDKRIGNVPYDPNTLVHTAWDLGFGDATAIWFFQVAGQEIHVIDFYQDNGKALADYIHHVKSKPYIYGEHIAPHDIQVHEFSTGKTRMEVARNLGLHYTVCDKLTVMEGIDAVRGLFPRMWFDERKCEEGIRMLENYRKTWDDKFGRWSDKPLHNYASNASDGMRYLAIGMNRITATKGSVASDFAAVRKYWGG